MQATFNGELYRIGFQYDRLWAQEVDGLDALAAREGRIVRKGKVIEAPRRPVTMLRVDAEGIRAEEAWMVTRCLVWRVTKPDEGFSGGTKPGPRTAVAQAASVCSSAERSPDKEFGRQVALGRAFLQLPRALRRPLFGAYMASGPRSLRDLSAVKFDGFPRGMLVDLSDIIELDVSYDPKPANSEEEEREHVSER